MGDEDHDADIYEETSSKVTYKRSSTTRPVLVPQSSLTDLTPSDSNDVEESRRESIRRHTSWTDLAPEETQEGSSYTAVERETSFRERARSNDEFNSLGRDESLIGRMDWRGVSREDSEVTRSLLRGSLRRMSENARRVLRDKHRKSWPLKQKEMNTGTRKSSEGDEAYYPVTKWAVDYTNKNYIRSQCNKPVGHHRYTIGRTFDWDVDYDNSFYARSHVNAPKGLHRRKEDAKRKRVPDNDILADSRGWEFEYGPEFPQAEEDVPYMPEERLVTRGAYRCYGVRRNNSDTDSKILVEGKQRENIKGLIKDEFKYGGEFFQDDVPHIVQAKDRRIGRGAYLFYEAQRSKCDEHVSGDELEDSEGESFEEAKLRKGRKFKQTILKKTLEKPKALPREARFGTQLTFVPGEEEEGEELEGISTTLPSLKHKRIASIRSAFKQRRKRDEPQTPEETRSSGHKEDFNPKDIWKKHKQKSSDTKSRYSTHSQFLKDIREKEELMSDSEKDEYLINETQPRRRSTSVREEDENLARKRSTSIREVDENQARRRSTSIREQDEIPPWRRSASIKEQGENQARRRSTSIREQDEIPPWRRSISTREEDDILPRRRSTSIRDYDNRIRAFGETQPRGSISIREQDHRLVQETQPRRRSTSIRDQGYRTSVQGKHEKRSSYGKSSLASRRSLFKRSEEDEDTEEVFVDDSPPRPSMKEDDDRIYTTAAVWGKPRESLRNEERSTRRSNVRVPERIRDEDYPRGSYSRDTDNDEDGRIYTSAAVWGKPRTSRSPEKLPQLSTSGSGSNEQIYASTAVWGKVENERRRDHKNFLSKQNSKSNNKKFNSRDIWKKAIQKKASKSKWDEIFSEEEGNEDYGKQQRREDMIVHAKQDEREALKKLPPHVEKRIRSLKNRISKCDTSGKEQHLRALRPRGDGNKNVHKVHEGDFDIDLGEHIHHPNDYGQQGKQGYEKYVTENGSEIWEKAEEKFTELHHRH